MQPGEWLACDDRAVRVGDADRDEAVGDLRQRFVEGRLSQDSFLRRVDAALRARDRSDLDALFADLPATAQGRPRGRIGSWLAGRRRPAIREAGAARGMPGGMAAGPPPLWLPWAQDRRLTIGRAMACDFTLADLSVSRWHARLYRKDGDWLLSDLGSTNGTRLNGWRVTTAVPVRPGDLVTFGSVSFVISDRGRAAG